VPVPTTASARTGRSDSDKGCKFIARTGGRLRRFHIKVVPGDHLTIVVSPYDPTHRLIVHRG
jgi:translation initiation factor IF-1